MLIKGSVNPKGSVGQQVGSMIQGSVGAVSPPPAGPYTPMEDGPEWHNVSISPVASNTTDDHGEVFFNGNTSPRQAIAHGLWNFVDGYIGCIPRFEEPGTGAASFFMTIRMADNENFIGLRSYGNLIQVYDVINALLYKIGEVSNSGTLGKDMHLIVSGNRVVVTSDSLNILDVTTLVLDTGFAGCAPGFHTPALAMADSYTVHVD